MGAFTDQAGSDGWNNKNVNSVDSSSLFDKCVGNEWRDIVIPYDKNKTITLSYQQIIDKIWALDSGGKVAVNIYFSYCFYSGDSWLYSYSPENINFNNNP
jgi:nuclear transport factor 2 (NTF2) superfamily protein